MVLMIQILRQKKFVLRFKVASMWDKGEVTKEKQLFPLKHKLTLKQGSQTKFLAWGA